MTALERTNVANLKRANMQKTATARLAVDAAIERLLKSAARISINAVAKEAGVSRGFIYSKPEVKAHIMTLAERPPSRVRASSARPNEASLAARLETALITITELKAEKRALNKRIENLTAQLYEHTVN